MGDSSAVGVNLSHLPLPMGMPPVSAEPLVLAHSRHCQTARRIPAQARWPGSRPVAKAIVWTANCAAVPITPGLRIRRASAAFICLPIILTIRYKQLVDRDARNQRKALMMRSK